MVLRIHPVRADGYRYYVDDLVPGRAEASPVAGESPGVWTGDGRAALGLDGLVEAPVFAEVLEGRHPVSGAALRRRRGARTVSGFDLTFGAPKSVSILHLLAPGEMAGQVGAGHRAAVEEAVAYLGREGVGVRRIRQGRVAYVGATGAVAGAFVHRTSRDLDPHLHTHLVVANVAQGLDGTWSAVDSRRLFHHRAVAQSLYHARLRFELTGRLGVAWTVRPSGLGDVVGVDPVLRGLFSQRAASMAEYDVRRSGVRHRTGDRAGAGAGAGAGIRSQASFHATRSDKDRSWTVEALATRWKERATDLGFDLGDLTRVVGLGRDAARSAPDHPTDTDRLVSRIEALAGPGGTVSRRQLVEAVATASIGGAPAHHVESIADAIAVEAGTPDRVRSDVGPGSSRWAAGSLIRVVERRPEVVMAPDGPAHGSDRSRGAGPGPEMGRPRARGQEVGPFDRSPRGTWRGGTRRPTGDGLVR